MISFNSKATDCAEQGISKHTFTLWLVPTLLVLSLLNSGPILHPRCTIPYTRQVQSANIYRHIYIFLHLLSPIRCGRISFSRATRPQEQSATLSQPVVYGHQPYQAQPSALSAQQPATRNNPKTSTAKHYNQTVQRRSRPAPTVRLPSMTRLTTHPTLPPRAR